MNFTKRVRCFFRLNSAWAQCSAVCMGLSVFIRVVCYLGIINFNDLTPYLIVTQLVLPLVLAAGYLIMLRGLRFNSPVLMGFLSMAFSLCYLLITVRTGAAILSAVLMIATAGVLILTGMGIWTTRLPLFLAAAATLLYRVIAVDWMNYLNAPDGFRFLAYLPELSNFFVLASLLSMCFSVRLVPIQRTAPNLMDTEAPAEPQQADSAKPDPDVKEPEQKASAETPAEKPETPVEKTEIPAEQPKTSAEKPEPAAPAEPTAPGTES